MRFAGVKYIVIMATRFVQQLLQIMAQIIIPHQGLCFTQVEARTYRPQR